MYSIDSEKISSIKKEFSFLFYRCLNNEERTMQFISNNCELITGYSHFDFIDSQSITYKDLIHPNDRKMLLELSIKHLTKFKECVIEYKILCKDKKVKLVREYSYAIFNKKNELVFIEGKIREINSKTEALNFTRHLPYYLNALNNASIISVTDKSGEIIFANDYFCNYSQYKKAELIGNTHKIINSGFHPPSFFKDLWKTILAGKTWRGDIKNKAKDGSYYWSDTVITPILNEANKVEQFLSIRNDITEKKEIEIKLAESEAFNKSVLASMNSHIAVIDENGLILSVNKAWEEFAEQNGGLLISTGPGVNYFSACENAELMGDKYASKVLIGLKDVIAKTKKTFQLEYPCHSKDTQRWFLLTASLLNNEKPKVVIRHINITARKNTETYLEKLINELTDKNNELMQFNYIVSHNLRSPIVNIIGLINMFNSPYTKKSEKPAIIEHIKAASTKMDSIIKDLSIILSTKSSLNSKKEDVNISEVIENIFEIFETQIKEGNCSLISKVSPKAKYIYTIKSYFESILLNLISNAIKYKSPKRKAQITISSFIKEGDLILTVKDNGIGIDLQKHGEYVFGLYKRFNREIEGKGLGLHMTKTEVEALGGKIKIDSIVNKGTCFTITFPIIYK